MKRVVTALAVAAVAALLAPPASAHPICVYGRTPYPIVCVNPPEA